MPQFMEILETLTELLGNLRGIAGSISSIFEVIGAVVAAVTVIAGSVTTVAALITSLIGIAGTILTAVCAALAYLLGHYFQAIPTFILARRAKSKLAWLCWFPIPYVNMFVQCDIAGKEPLRLFGRFYPLRNRMVGCIFAFFVAVFGTNFINGLISLLIAVLSNSVPGIGQIISILAAVLSLVPFFILAYYNFLTLRDILNLYRDDGRSNLSLSLLAAAVDTLILHYDLIRTLTLYKLMFSKPISTALVVQAEFVGPAEAEESTEAPFAADTESEENETVEVAGLISE